MYKRIRSLSDKRRILAEYQDLEHPMLEAVKKGDAVGVQRLAMNLGSDAVNEQDAEGWTPLHEASTRGRADIVKVLLNFQANPNVLSQVRGSRRSPLWRAQARFDVHLISRDHASIQRVSFIERPCTTPPPVV